MTIIDLLFGCLHSHYTFPQTPKSRPGKRLPKATLLTGTYVVCIECGKEFPYDWNEMKVIIEPETDSSVAIEAAVNS